MGHPPLLKHTLGQLRGNPSRRWLTGGHEKPRHVVERRRVGYVVRKVLSPPRSHGLHPRKGREVGCQRLARPWAMKTRGVVRDQLGADSVLSGRHRCMRDGSLSHHEEPLLTPT